MSRRFASALAVVTALSLSTLAPRAHAQERAENAQQPIPSVRVLQLANTPRTVDFDSTAFPVPPAPRPRGSALLNSLYVSTIAVHALDVHSTMLALDRGAVEANPLMAGVVKNKAAFIATKAAVATGSFFAARNLARRNRVAAIITMTAINSAYAMIVQNNYRVARQLK